MTKKECKKFKKILKKERDAFLEEESQNYLLPVDANFITEALICFTVRLQELANKRSEKYSSTTATMGV